MSAARQATRVLISGRVQGVFFRDAVRAEAERRNLAGWVRNLDDGRVEAWLEGEPRAVDAVVTWCGEGVAGASVTAVEAEPAVAANLDGFEIR